MKGATACLASRMQESSSVWTATDKATTWPKWAGTDGRRDKLAFLWSDNVDPLPKYLSGPSHFNDNSVPEFTRARTRPCLLPRLPLTLDAAGWDPGGLLAGVCPTTPAAASFPNPEPARSRRTRADRPSRSDCGCSGSSSDCHSYTECRTAVPPDY